MRALALVISAACLAACGTTVPQVQQVGAPAANGLGQDQGLGSSAAPGASAAPPALAPGSSSYSTGQSAAVVSNGAPGSAQLPATSVGGVQGYGQGLSATSVKVGFMYDPNVDAASATLGSGLGTGNARAMEEAYAADINSHGGLGGRRIVLDPFQINAESTDYNAELAAACSHFTSDAHDFAAFGGRGNPFATCLDKGGVLGISSNLTTTSDADFRLAPHYFEPSTLDLDRRGRNLPIALNAQGWFSGTPKVGVISYDDIGFKNAVSKELLPGLKALGHAPASADVQYVPYPQGYGEYGSLSSAVASAVLKFRQDGVDHVVLLDATGVMTLFFMQAAENQLYRPLYGLDTAAGVETLYEGGDISKNQAQNATGLGWIPGLDVPAANVPKNAAAAKCLAFFASKGMAAGNNNGRAVQLGICDEYATLRASLAADAHNRDDATHAIERLGSFPAAVALGVRFTPLHHDGVSAYRFLRWSGSCGCMAYVGGNREAV